MIPLATVSGPAANKRLDLLCITAVRTRVASMPSWEIFECQPAAYRDAMLPPACEARVAVEMPSRFGWERYVGRRGRVLRLSDFGASAPLRELLKEFGFTVDHVVAATRAVLEATR